MVASELGFLNAARPRPNGDGQPHSLASEANRPINIGAPSALMGAPSALMGAPSALFSLRRIPHFLVLALLLVFGVRVGAGREFSTAQDWIMNRYYEAEARENALRQEQSSAGYSNKLCHCAIRFSIIAEQIFSFPPKAFTHRCLGTDAVE